MHCSAPGETPQSRCLCTFGSRKPNCYQHLTYTTLWITSCSVPTICGKPWCIPSTHVLPPKNPKTTKRHKLTTRRTAHHDFSLWADDEKRGLGLMGLRQRAPSSASDWKTLFCSHKRYPLRYPSNRPPTSRAAMTSSGATFYGSFSLLCCVFSWRCYV